MRNKHEPIMWVVRYQYGSPYQAGVLAYSKEEAEGQLRRLAGLTPERPLDSFGAEIIPVALVRR